VRVLFTVLLVGVAPDPVPPAAAVSLSVGAIAAIVGAGVAVGARWAEVVEVSPWLFASAVSDGRLPSTPDPVKKPGTTPA
jgi:hypothetical protein